MFNNLVGFVKANKDQIIKKVSIVGGVLVGLAVAGLVANRMGAFEGEAVDVLPAEGEQPVEETAE